MNQQERKNQIADSITSLSKSTYHRSEVLSELLSYQQEIVTLATGYELEKPRLWDAVKHLERLNKDCGGIASESLEVFKRDCKMITDLIKSEISGIRGEDMAFKSLDRLNCENQIIRNLELDNEVLRTEYDAVAVTRKGVFIIEVKNTSKNIFIDEHGGYFKTGRYLKYHYNIKNKLQVKEDLVRNVLDKFGYSGIKIFKILVFTNNRIEIQSKCKTVRTCFINQLTHIIEDCKSPDYLTTKDLNIIANRLNQASLERTYPIGFDTLVVKMNFATVMAELENAKNHKQPAWLHTIYTFFKSRASKYACAAAIASIISSIA